MGGGELRFPSSLNDKLTPSAVSGLISKTIG
jgi:hypothetical protein